MQDFGFGPCRQNPVDGRCERTILIRDGWIAHAMRLFCDVGKVEIGRERSHQIDHLLQVELSQHHLEANSGVLVAIGPACLREEPNLLDELEQLIPVLTRQGVAELGTEPTNVAPEKIIATAVCNRVHGFERLPLRVNARTVE